MMTAHSMIQVSASFGILGIVVALMAVFRFDVISMVLFRGVHFEVDDDNIDTTVSGLPSSWIPFLGGEFTMTVLLPVGVYGLWLSKPTLVSLPDQYNPVLLFPVGMLVAILTGLLAAHAVFFDIVHFPNYRAMTRTRSG
jgi:hypothetical protein